MLMTIYAENKHTYQTGSYSEVKEIRWRAGPLDASVLRRFPSLQLLDCTHAQVGSLKGLDGCPTLRELHCNWNGLTTLEGIESCSQLRVLHCSWNNLTTLIPLRACTQLEKLHIVKNNLETLVGIEGCLYLRGIHCSWNKLVSLQGIEGCRALKDLDCEYNVIKSLRGIEACTALGYLCCGNNQLRSLDLIVYLRHLCHITHRNNPLDIQSPQVERLLAHPLSSRQNSIYNDNQNVHDPRVQRSVRESLQNLLTDSRPIFSIDYFINSELDEKTKQLLTEYCLNESVHSDHLLTYAELLAYVWARIIRSEHAAEMLRILEEQIADAECKCFTGRFNRTISVLVGFYPDIMIQISDSSRISAIMIAIQNRLDPYDSQVHLETARVELMEAGYTADEIEPWLGAITEV